MSDLLGFEPTPRADAEPTPELIALAEELRKEALRRKRLERRRPTWGLLAAAVLPLAIAVAGLGVWGQGNRAKAEALAATAAQKTQELEQKLQAHKTELAQERATREQLTKVLAQAGPKGRKSPYLVIPADPVQAPGQDQVRVSAKP